MRCLLLCLPAICLCCSVYAQKATIVYRNLQDSSVSYYLVAKPKSQPVALLALIPGFGESPEYVAAETAMVAEATRHGILTVIITLQQGTQSFCVDSTSQQAIGALISDAQKRYKLTKAKLYIGGFSLGGSGVVRYAERTIREPSLPRPSAIFAIDPPLDFARFYTSLTYQQRTSQSATAVAEAAYFISRMQSEFGGSPEHRPRQYATISPYVHADTTLTNAQLLRSMPTRLICEPDIHWQMAERGRTYYDLNAIDCAALIASLNRSGNKSACYVTTSGKGYRRQQKKRNPHSWSIADPRTTIDWLLRY